MLRMDFMSVQLQALCFFSFRLEWVKLHCTGLNMKLSKYPAPQEKGFISFYLILNQNWSHHKDYLILKSIECFCY